MSGYDFFAEKCGWKNNAHLGPTNFFVLSSSAPEGAVDIAIEPFLSEEAEAWITGERINIEVPKPLIYKVEPFDEHDGIMRSYYRALDIPLMSKKLIAALQACGVDNLETYDAVIQFNGSKKINTDYLATNILGLVAAANLGKSEYRTSSLTTPEESTTLWFDKMVLDEEKVKDKLLFRMAESITTVLINKVVKEKIEKDFPDLKFFHPEEYSM